jgi:hypothetical protein
MSKKFVLILYLIVLFGGMTGRLGVLLQLRKRFSG